MFERSCSGQMGVKWWGLLFLSFNIFLYLVMSQSDDVEHSSAYCFATTMGARQT